MKISTRKLKNAKVFYFGEAEPFGIISDTIIDEYGKVAGYLVKTISIVPISKIISVGDILKFDNGKVILLNGITPANSEHFKSKAGTNLVYAGSIKNTVEGEKRRGKLKDIRFDMETGEIYDLVVLKNIIAGKEEISVNKISAKDNTIYIEKQCNSKEG